MPRVILPPKLTPRHPLVCVGLRSRTGGLRLLATAPPARVDVARPPIQKVRPYRLHLKAFETPGAAHEACCALNFGEGLIIGEETYGMETGECAVVVKTSLDALALTGWNDFDLDVCAWGAPSECRVLTTTAILAVSDPRGDAEYLERMLKAGPDL